MSTVHFYESGRAYAKFCKDHATTIRLINFIHSLYYLTFVQLKETIDTGRQLLPVMAHIDQCRIERFAERSDQGPEVGRLLIIQPLAGLIQDQHRRILDQRTRQQYHSLLPRGQLRQPFAA